MAPRHSDLDIREICLKEIVVMEKGEQPDFTSPIPSKTYNRMSFSAESSPRALRRGTSMTWQYSDADSPESKRERHQRLNVGMMISPPLSTSSSSSQSGSDQSHSSDDYDGRNEARVGAGDWGRSPTSLVDGGKYGKKPSKGTEVRSMSAIGTQEASETIQILPSVTHVALEYGIPDLNYSVSIGGLYKVLDLFIRKYPLALNFIVPKLADFPPNALPPPQHEFLVTVLGTFVPVQVHVLTTSTCGYRRTFLLVSSQVFEKRTARTIYQCTDASEEMVLYSSWSQAVAQVLALYPTDICHLHDYHASLSILYRAPHLDTKFCLTLHNGDFQGSWRILNGDHRRWIQSAFNLSDAHFGNFCEHSGTFNCLKAGLTALHHWQNGEGVVAVSPRYGDRLGSKHSIFWAARKVSGILNAVDPEEKPQIDVINLAQWKREGKEWIQQKFGLRITPPKASPSIPTSITPLSPAFSVATSPACRPPRGSHVGDPLFVFLGRQSFQKGSDLIGAVADEILNRYSTAQLVVVGPCTDEFGEAAIEDLKAVFRKFPDRVHCEDRLVHAEEREYLMRAADFVLVPSRFEPCGLVDIEFGWRGALCVGFDQGGLGKMPGFYRSLLSTAPHHQQAQLVAAITDAMAASASEKEGMRLSALETTFPPEVMFYEYSRLYMQLHGRPLPPTPTKSTLRSSPPLPPCPPSRIPPSPPPPTSDSPEALPLSTKSDTCLADPLKGFSGDLSLEERKGGGGGGGGRGEGGGRRRRRRGWRIHETVLFLAYILNFAPGFLVLLTASSWWWKDSPPTSSVLDVATCLLALYSVVYGIFSFFWSLVALRCPPAVLLPLGLCAQAVSIATFALVASDAEDFMIAACLLAACAAMVPPVMIGLNFLEDVPGEVAIGRRIGAAEFLRNFCQAGVGAMMVLATGPAVLAPTSVRILTLSLASVFALLALLLLFFPPPPLYRSCLLPQKGQLGLLAYRKTVWVVLGGSVLQGVTAGAMAFFVMWVYAIGWTPGQAAAGLATTYITAGIASLLSGFFLERIRFAHPISGPLAAFFLPPSAILFTLSWRLLGHLSPFYVTLAMCAATIPGALRLLSTNYILLQTLAREHFVLAIGLRGLCGGVTMAFVSIGVRMWLGEGGLDIRGGGGGVDGPALALALSALTGLFGGLEYAFTFLFFKTYPRECLDIP